MPQPDDRGPDPGEAPAGDWQLLHVIGAAVAISLIGLIGAGIPKKWIKRLSPYVMALAVGSMIGLMFLDLIPHMLEHPTPYKTCGHDHGDHSHGHDHAGCSGHDVVEDQQVHYVQQDHHHGHDHAGCDGGHCGHDHGRGHGHEEGDHGHEEGGHGDGGHHDHGGHDHAHDAGHAHDGHEQEHPGHAHNAVRGVEAEELTEEEKQKQEEERKKKAKEQEEEKRKKDKEDHMKEHRWHVLAGALVIAGFVLTELISRLVGFISPHGHSHSHDHGSDCDGHSHADHHEMDDSVLHGHAAIDPITGEKLSEYCEPVQTHMCEDDRCRAPFPVVKKSEPTQPDEETGRRAHDHGHHDEAVKDPEAGDGKEAGHDNDAAKEADINCGCCSLPYIVVLDLVGRVIHHTVEGMLVGMQNDATAVWTLVGGLAAHEIGHVVGGYGLYVHLGVRKRLSVLLIFLALLTYLPVSVVTYLSLSALNTDGEKSQAMIEYYVNPIAFGIFLHLTFIELVPELKHLWPDKKTCTWRSALMTVILAASVGIMAICACFLHDHGHPKKTPTPVS